MNAQPETLGEAVGLWLGYCVAPALAAGTWLRRARVFHPVGVLYQGIVEPSPEVPSAYAALAAALAGQARVRFSASAWKQESFLPDVLGCAIRFGVDDSDEKAQDLMLVTAPRLALLPLYFFKTNQHDFLANDFYGAAPFRIMGAQHHVRIVPDRAPETAGSREARLEDAVDRGMAALQLEVAPVEAPEEWYPIVELRLERVPVSHQSITFSPFQAARGIQPCGFIHYLRDGAYVLSQFARTWRK